MKTDILYLNNTPYENGKLSGEYFRKNVIINLEEINNVLLNNDIKNQIVSQLDNLKNEYVTYGVDKRYKQYFNKHNDIPQHFCAYSNCAVSTKTPTMTTHSGYSCGSGAIQTFCLFV